MTESGGDFGLMEMAARPYFFMHSRFPERDDAGAALDVILHPHRVSAEVLLDCLKGVATRQGTEIVDACVMTSVVSPYLVARLEIRKPIFKRGLRGEVAHLMAGLVESLEQGGWNLLEDMRSPGDGLEGEDGVRADVSR